ncbi:MAG: DEAD/DEAH box helicase [Thiohalomonadaceae bacterium]
MSFASLNLGAPLLRAIENLGFTEPTEIQRRAIPVLMEGRDLMASAQTGTGKTAAFVLPALQRLLVPSAARGIGPRVLVLTPTRELATQVEENIREFGRFSRPVTASVVGGVPYPPQIRALSRPVDILVATPGRLMDHMERGRIDFSRLEMLVLDEADRMLDMGFLDDVRHIAAATPASRQTALFSATLEGSVLAVAKELLNDPARLQLAAAAMRHERIAQRAHRADDLAHKHALLAHIIGTEELDQAVVFTATKAGAESLAQTLTEQGHACAALHGDMGQRDRKRTVDRMRRREVRLLVATDVAARGLDIAGISHVINFDLPMAAEDYIHRIGRTGRGGASGTAITFVGPADRPKLGRIERLTGSRLEYAVIPGLEPRLEPVRRRPGGPRRDGRHFSERGNRPSNGPRRNDGFRRA